VETDSPVRQTFTRQPATNTVLVADGYGVSITVNRGQLIVEDGIGHTRRTRKVSRVPCELARLVILADTGMVSLEALRWCADLNISVVQLDRTGRILMSSPGQAGDARLRAAQAHAAPGDTLSAAGLEIVRYLMTAKLTGQADLTRDVFNDVERERRIRDQIARLQTCTSVSGILASEGQSANAYWRTWKDQVFVPFSPTDLSSVPVTWYQFTSRASRILAGELNQHASDPVNAMLNYAYRLCEVESRHACHIMGLDPSLGFGHGHDKKVEACVFDLMESARAQVDHAVLSMLDTGHGVPMESGRPLYFDRRWFTEESDGTCKLHAPLTHMLAELVSLKVAPVVGAHAEHVAKMLAHSSRYNIQPGKLITLDQRFKNDHTSNTTKLDVNLSPSDLIPDAIWYEVSQLIPAEPSVRTHKPVPRADNRAVLAGILCHEVYGTSWSGLPPGLGVDRKTCRRRLQEWERLDAWPSIRETVLRSRVTADQTG
jgi:CRISPR-associated endonuclease Cas1